MLLLSVSHESAGMSLMLCRHFSPRFFAKLIFTVNGLHLNLHKLPSSFGRGPACHIKRTTGHAKHLRKTFLRGQDVSARFVAQKYFET